MVAGNPVAIQSPASTRLRVAVCGRRPPRILARQRGEGGAAFAHDLPARQRSVDPGDGAHFAPDFFGERFARRLQQPVGGADRHRQPVRKSEQPFDHAVHDAGQRRDVFCRRDAEVGVDDGAELSRRLQAGNKICGDHGRHREHHRIVRRQAHRIVGKLQRRHQAALDRQRPQAMAELHIGFVPAQIIERRFDESVAQTVARDERAAGAPAGGQRLADHGGGEYRGAFLRLGIQRRQQDRADQPMKQDAIAVHRLTHRLLRLAPQ